MMFRMIYGVAAVAFFATTSVHAQVTSGSRLDEILKRGTLRVGMTGDYLPFTSVDKTTSTFRGFDVDMAETLGEALGVVSNTSRRLGRR